MELRAYQTQDLESVVQLWRDTGLAVGHNNPHKDIQRKLKVDPDLFLVALVDNQIIGTVMGGYEGHRGWINYLAVCPTQQRKGVARKLMKKVENLIKEKGCPKINLQVRSTNDAVIGFYSSLGYANDTVISLGKRLIDDQPS